MAMVVVLGGTLQLAAQVRRRAAWLHRWNGRIFLTMEMLVAVTGLVMDVAREIALEGLSSNFAISFNGVLVHVLVHVPGTLTWRTAAVRNYARHRCWALRTFAVGPGVFFLRMRVFGYTILAQEAPSEARLAALGFLSYLAPLALRELYIRAKERPAPARLAMAGVVLGAAACTAVGFVGYSLIFVQQALNA
ncbi:MAG: DUF2306 domain-containing protein [Hyphomonas sp.]|uniref:DUF2306 domain-containing protein n=1 Tax=Hyphomonas sp. TaxID=87 RepID=UPI0034A002D6